MNDILVDLPAERAVLGGIYQHGQDAYLDVADFIKIGTFSDMTNQAVYRCLHHLFETKGFQQIEEADLMVAMSETGMDHIMSKPEEVRYVRSIINSRVGLSNIRRWAAKLRKLEISRLLVEQLDVAKTDIQAIRGDEPIEHILGLAENAIFDFTSLISSEDDGEPELITNGLRDWLEYLESNPVDNVGISSGMGHYDFSIGGGFRRKTVSLIGARPKIGKSMLSLTIGVHVAKKLGIPVLYLDTEMTKEDHWSRLMPMACKQNNASVTIGEIETGKYANDAFHLQKVHETLDDLEKCNAPFYYKNITGKPFEDILGIMRRWVHKVVGLDENGSVKDCLIIYDYMKLMSSDSINEGLKEYQIMGFMMTTLHNFAVRHDVPILSFIQLNREGENSDGGAVISQSDRILWLVTNFCIFRTKTDEEVVEMGPNQGNRKMVPIAARHGEGLIRDDYINMNMEGKYAFITELDLRSEVMRAREARASGNQQIREPGIPDEALRNDETDESIPKQGENQ